MDIYDYMQGEGPPQALFVEKVVGRLVMTIARLDEKLTLADKEIAKKRQVELNNEEWEKICNQRVDTAIAGYQHSIEAPTNLVCEKLEFALKHICLLPDQTFDQMFEEERQKPNARELAIAQSKGEFPEAIYRYRTRVGLTHDDAKEKLKNALGLSGTIDDIKTKKRASAKRAKR